MYKGLGIRLGGFRAHFFEKYLFLCLVKALQNAESESYI